MKNSNTTTLRSVWIGLGFVSTFLVSSRSEPAADRPSIELPIARVMVYEDRALVERSGTVAVGAGISQVRITKLPVGLVEPSLRASLPEGGGAKILSVSSRTEEQLETQDERLRRLEKDKSDLEGNLRQLEAKSQVLRHERYQLEEIQNVVLRSLCQRATLGTVTMEQISSASDLLAKRRSAMNAALREISVQQRKLNDQRGDIQKNINKIATPNRKTIRYADVVIESPAGGDLTLTVNYLIANASWRPRYEARLNKGKLTVQYMGEVRQGTGEPWDNVELVLSTARPSLGAQRPELGYLRIDLEKVNVGTDLVSGVGAYAGAMGRPVETDAETPAGGGDVQVKESGTSVVFQLKGRYSVPSDRRAYKLPITEFEDASPKLTFETTPKLLTYVYLKCESSNKTSFPLLPGQVDIFRESGFMGTSSLAFVSPGRSLELSFGIDEDLKVKRVRDLKRTKVEKVGRKKVYTFVIDSEIANFKAARQTVIVQDNYPVSDIEEAVVMLGSETTTPDKNDRKFGKLQWSIELQPGEKKSIHLVYTVTVPRDYQWNPYAGEKKDTAPKSVHPRI